MSSEAMEYAIGIDGGGTKTHLLAADRDMRVLFEAVGGSSNLTCNSGAAVAENLNSLLERFTAESGLSLADCRGLCLGSAGAGRASSRDELRAILEKALPNVRVAVTDDAESALAGGTEHGSGILLVSGTGSICYAKNERGETCRVGGWGHVLGDEGSGYDMACRILRAVARAWDGRGQATVLTGLVEKLWSVSGMDALIDSVYRSGKGKTEIAALAVLCDIAYNDKDKVAFEIVEACACGLAEMALTAAAVFPGYGSIPCVFAGSLLIKSENLRAHLARRLREQEPAMRLLPCVHDAAWGCAKLAWQHTA